MFTKEYCDSSSFFGCRNNGYCSNCDSENDCSECSKTECKCRISKFMLSFYDEHELIVSNWLANGGSYNPADSKIINKMAESLDVDIQHLMWDLADEFLHRIKYVRIGTRNLIEDENGFKYFIEKGIEYDIYGKKMKRYRSKWYTEPTLNEQYNADSIA